MVEKSQNRESGFKKIRPGREDPMDRYAWITAPGNDGKCWELAVMIYLFYAGFSQITKLRTKFFVREIDIWVGHLMDDKELLVECHDSQTPTDITRVERIIAQSVLHDNFKNKTVYPVLATTSLLTESAEYLASETDVTIIRPDDVLRDRKRGAVNSDTEVSRDPPFLYGRTVEQASWNPKPYDEVENLFKW